MNRPAAILDVDGTLVDTNFHHTLAWGRAFADCGERVPLWRVHRHIGMGGDQIVPALLSEEWDREHGEEVRAKEKERYMALIEEVRPLPEAREMIVDLKERGHAVVLSSSAKEDELDHYLELLDARDLVDDWTMSADVEATKPEPDVVQSALDKLGIGPRDAFMVGDSSYDCAAAGRAGVPCVAFRSGGFGDVELRAAGALAVLDGPAHLRRTLRTIP